MAELTILGAGGMGTALAAAFSNMGHAVTLWGHRPEQNAVLREKRENERLLKGIAIPQAVTIADNIDCVSKSDAVIIAVPSSAVRETLERAAPFIRAGIPIGCVSKGLEKGSLLLLHEVARQVLPENPFVALSGPSHAEELARGVPTVLVAASEAPHAAEYMSRLAEGSNIRIYMGDDIVGAEIGGALKNVIAFAAGIMDGMGGGDNAKAALMTRGLSEIARLGVKMGAKRETFAGASGVGDLIVTCCSMHSRNRRCGIYVGEGMTVSQAVEKVGMTVEGITAALCAGQLAKKAGVELPITEQVCRIIEGETTARDALSRLMSRPVGYEHDSNWLQDS